MIGGRFYAFLEKAYTHANRTLLGLLLKDQALIPRLRSLKRYFFLSQSFFLTHFLDLASSELRKTSKSASIVKLQSLLDLAIGEGGGGGMGEVKITMASGGLYEWLEGILKVSGVKSGGLNVDEKEKEKPASSSSIPGTLCSKRVSHTSTNSSLQR